MRRGMASGGRMFNRPSGLPSLHEVPQLDTRNQLYTLISLGGFAAL